MTTFYTFHNWIEPSSTTNTVVLVFGGWWDAAEVPSGFKPYWLRRSTQIIGGGVA